MLWSDPIEDDDTSGGDVIGVHESPRGNRFARFGWDVTKTFCARNGLSLIVRSHQSTQDGLGIDIMHDNLLVRVFSARDYEGHANDGATLLIDKSSEQSQLMTVKAQILRSTTKERGNVAADMPSTCSTRRKSSRRAIPEDLQA